MKEWFKKIGKNFTKKKDLNKKVTNKIGANEIKHKEAINKAETKEIKHKEIINKVDTKEIKKPEQTKENWFYKLGENFRKTSSNIKDAIFVKKLNESNLEEIEEAFIMSDLGVSNTELLINEIKDKKLSSSNIQEHVAEFLEKQFSDINHQLVFRPDKGLRIILIFGVNGSGKTTTIAKLAKIAKNEKLKELLAAADTFRAAKEQIEKWASLKNKFYREILEKIHLLLYLKHIKKRLMKDLIY